MKRWLILSCLLLLIFISPSSAVIVGQTVTSGPSCSTANDELLVGYTGDGESAANTSTINCLKITIPVGADVTEYKCDLCDDGSDTGDIDIELYTHDAGNDDPESLVANSTLNVAASTITNDCPNNDIDTFTLGATLENLMAGTYWICIEENNSAAIKVLYEADVGERICTGAVHGSLDCDDNYSLCFDVWGCP